MINDINNKQFFFQNNSNTQTKSVRIAYKNYHEEWQKKITIPGSKSFTNRAIVLAGMSAKPTILNGCLFAEDTFWGLHALRTLGFTIEIDADKNSVKLIPPSHFTGSEFKIFLGKAGTLARFFPAVILNWQNTFSSFPEIKVYFDAHEQLKSRPLEPLISALIMLNAKISDMRLPFMISSSQLIGSCEIGGEISGQFLSGLLLAACASQNSICVKRINKLVQPDYINMTLSTIEAFGGNINYDKDLTNFVVRPVRDLGVETYSVEADASTCCYFIAAAFLHNFSLHINNIGYNTLQPDYKFIETLKMLGAQIVSTETATTVYRRNNLEKITGNFSFDLSNFSDQTLTLAVVALFADLPIEIYGIAHIRFHECDRIACLVANIKNLNLKIEEYHDRIIVYPIKNNFHEIKGEWKSWNDHRFVMAGFLIASMCESVSILEPSCVEKTCPRFFDLVQQLGFQISFTS
jgi:3-phosphoshikimate 1-carboxyvinyltransferase